MIIIVPFVLVFALFTALIVQYAWQESIPYLFPKLVELQYLPKKIAYWPTYWFCILLGVLVK